MGGKTFILAMILFGGQASVAMGQDYPRYRAVGSTYVPLNSWIYPVFERLAAQGYVQTAMLGMKPWTRFECARLVDEAEEILRTRVLEDKRVEEQAAQAVEALAREFAHDLELLGGGPNRTARLESLYTRVTSISGPPLTDGLHFGQTISYDFGRPNRRGTNAIAGGSAYAATGLFAFYVQAEYQHAPSAPALSDAVLDHIARVDLKPRENGVPFAPVNRARLMEAYVAFNFKNWQISAGRQSLSWGFGEGGSMLLSNNAEPLPMVRLARVVPHKLPGFLRHLGPVRSEFFFSRLDGQTFVPRPFFYGHKTSIKPHPRLELAFARTTMLGGGDFPLTFTSFFRSLVGTIDPNDNTNPGDSRTAFDIYYVLPGFGDSVTLYSEFYSEDDEIYFTGTNRSAPRAGIYLSRLPGLSKMDFRAEGATTEPRGRRDQLPSLNYYNFQYRDGYAQRGALLGNVVGRAGTAVQLWTSYWFSPAHRLQVNYKFHRVSEQFVPGGGQVHDYAVRYERHLRSGIYLRSSIQVESIVGFPVLFSGARKNVAALVELGFLGREREP